MSIAYLINQYPKVSHTFIRREILAIEALGFPIKRFALRGWGERPESTLDQSEQGKTEYVLNSGFSVLIFALVKAMISSPGRFSAALHACVLFSRKSPRAFWVHLVYLAEAALVRSRMSQLGILHLHAHFGTNAAEIACLSYLMGGPRYSFTVHGPEEFDNPNGLHLALKIQHAHFVVTVSSFGRSQVMRWVKSDQWEKVKVVHCGIDSDFLTQEGQATPDPHNPIHTFVCVGRLCEQKGQQLLIQAFARVLQRYPDARLVLAGDGEDRAIIENLLRTLNIQSSVEITGWITSDQVAQHIRKARALVLPSFAEGLPVVLMEAFALEKPVIATYIAGIPELVIDKINGWLIPAGAMDLLEEAILCALHAPESKLQAMGIEGRNRILKEFLIEGSAEKLSRYWTM